MDQQISLLPHPRSIFFSSLRFRLSLPARCSIHSSSRQKSASPLQGGNGVGGKVIRPLATKSFLADSCFIILHPASTRGWLYNSGLFVFLSLSRSLLRWPCASSFQSLFVSTLDRCATRAWKNHDGYYNADARGAYRGCCCKLGFYDGNSHTRSGQRL